MCDCGVCGPCVVRSDSACYVVLVVSTVALALYSLHETQRTEDAPDCPTPCCRIDTPPLPDPGNAMLKKPISLSLSQSAALSPSTRSTSPLPLPPLPSFALPRRAPTATSLQTARRTTACNCAGRTRPPFLTANLPPARSCATRPSPRRGHFWRVREAEARPAQRAGKRFPSRHTRLSPAPPHWT